MRTTLLVAFALILSLSGCECDKPSAVGLTGGGGTVGGEGGASGGSGGGRTLPAGGGGGAGAGAGDGTCVPRTCGQLAFDCGPAGDGCGGLLNCGACTAPQTCGGGGAPSKCGGTAGCVPLTCASANIGCGVIADGCGGLLDCNPVGGCPTPQTCGGGGTFGQCGGTGACIPRSCTAAGANCGPVADGCGNLLECSGDGGCPAPSSCGGGGLASRCGGNSTVLPDGGVACAPRTCAQQGIGCGLAGDGCGATISCDPPGGCPGAQTCGGGGVLGQCGAPVCVAKACAQLGIFCGPSGDGCGGLLNCDPPGGCPVPQTCGGGGIASQCGGTATCVPKTCAQLGIGCGPAGDGCGALLNCNPPGGCPSPQTCGGGGVFSQCGAPAACVPKTCAQLGLSCGAAGNGCGGIIAGGCGTCVSPAICGGGGVPGVCGDRPDAGPDGGKPCTNLCLQQVSCPDGGFTTISGTVVTGTNPAWGAPDPVYGALVYVPNAPLKPFDAGVSCDQCAAASGSPLVSVATGPDGRFTLTNVPANVSFPLVVQLGKWRRQVTIPAVATCQVTPLSAGTVRLPRNSSEGDIPLMAIATGQVDPIECVLRKMGLDDAEFTVPSGTGRVRMYQDNGADMPLGSPSDTTLYASTAELNKYDMVLFPCRGSEAPKLATDVANVVSYANGGGRVFATHFSYVWFGDTLSGGRRWPWWPTANWVLNQTYSNNTSPPRPGNSMTAVVNATIPKGPAFQSWLQLVGATTTPGQLTLQAPRWDVNGVVPPTQSWVNTAPPPAGMQVSSKHLTFNTPLPPTDGGTVNQCGRVLFSDFHVNTGNSGGTTFPGACTNTALTAQEKVLEFMLFDLASCIVPDVPPPPTCSALTCASYPGVNCGQQSDGCGGLTANCGTCSAPATCGGGGVAGVCGPVCVPRTCAQLGNPCGPAGDGCGGLLTCATCVAPSSCGGSGTPNVCGAPACTPRTCASFPGVNCGQLGDGCGGLTASCGTCAGGQICGGGGTPNVCGGSCVPLTCAQLGLSCGQGSDGCGGLTALCGTCPSGQWCGGGTGPGLCGNGRNCTPVSCSAQGLNCGPAGDGCGSVIQCGGCTVAGETCGGGSIPGVCGLPACTPRTCAQLGSTCGQAGDGCGRILDCGSCTVTGETCGGGGVPGVCGRPLCTPNTCAGLRFNCGPAGDGCGGLLNCGTCTAPSVCGGLGLPGVCSVQIN